MNWKRLPVDERDLKLTESFENDLDRLCEIYNYPKQLLSGKSQTMVFDQKYLNAIANDLHCFLLDIANNWDNHRPMLLLSLALTSGDVIECGAGEGSTPYLREYCKFTGRSFQSYDSDRKWALKCGAGWVSDWEHPCRFDPSGGIWRKCGLLFVDHAPGEHRKVAIERMADKADIIVIHDTEEGGAGDYKFETIWHLFKYRLNYNRLGGGAGATAVSNTIDLNRFRGLSLGSYKFDDD